MAILCLPLQKNLECLLPLPIPSQGSNNWLQGRAIIFYLCVAKPWLKFGLDFFDPKVVVIATVDPGPVCLPLTLNHFFCRLEFLFGTQNPFKNCSDDSKQVQTGANRCKR